MEALNVGRSVDLRSGAVAARAVPVDEDPDGDGEEEVGYDQ